MKQLDGSGSGKGGGGGVQGGGYGGGGRGRCYDNVVTVLTEAISRFDDRVCQSSVPDRPPTAKQRDKLCPVSCLGQTIQIKIDGEIGETTEPLLY